MDVEKQKAGDDSPKNAPEAEGDLHSQIQDYSQNAQKGENYHKLYLDARKDFDELLTRLKYMQADFENFKKRALKEKLEIIEIANESLLADMLIALDEMDAAISHLEEGEAKKGFALVRQNMQKTLGGYGLFEMKIKAGDYFDPDLCEAIGTQAAKNAKDEGKIESIAQKGYMLKGAVLRFAKARVYSFKKD